MKSKLLSNRRPALTLLELIVVMVILAALAGILVPLLPNIIGRAHSSTGAGNLAATGRQIQMHEPRYHSQRNNFSSLVTGAGAVGNSLLFNSAEPGTLSVATPNADQLESLHQAGITTVEPLAEAPADATFEPYLNAAPGTPVTLNSTTTKLVFLGANEIAALNLQPSGAYVAFGVGARSTAIGKSMQDAPVHFPEAGRSPQTEYSRPLAIYELPANGGAARFAAMAAIHHHDGNFGFAGISEHLKEYFEAVK